MTTIYEIAKKAGVSHTTVSRVFNKPHLVGKTTREKIISVSLENDYRPNLIARSMRTKKSNYIGLILPNIDNPFFSEVVRGAYDCAQKNNYSIILINSDNNFEIEMSSIQMFIDRGIDGVMLSGGCGGKKEEEFISKIQKIKTPVVFIDRYLHNIDSSYVINDNFKSGFEAASYLISLGHKNIGVIAIHQDVKIFKDRLDGYRKALEINGIAYDSEIIIEAEKSIEEGYLATEKLLKKRKKITAIFSICDFSAFGAYKYCRKNNINIPNQISIISIDNIFTSDLLTPPLTTVAQKKHEMGFTATKILIDSLKKNKIPKKKVILEPELIIRESCKKLTI